MVSVTLSIPDEVKKQMDHFGEINWSGFMRKAIIEKTRELTWKEQMLSKLQNEQGMNEWAAEIVRAKRKGRAIDLKEKGLI